MPVVLTLAYRNDEYHFYKITTIPKEPKIVTIQPASLLCYAQSQMVTVYAAPKVAL